LLNALGIAVLALALGQNPVQDPPSSPPIFQPGAPGQASRIVTAAEAVEMGRSTYTPADVAFMQHMIVHHAQAVEMVKLLETRGSSSVVKALGRRISLSQAAEMELMTEWLVARGQPLAAPDLHAGHAGHGAPDATDPHAGHSGHGGHAPAAPEDTPVMPGMLSPRQMRELAAADGPEFDRLFLAGMIQHHQGALDMVEALMETPNAAQDTMLSEFTGSVVADQSAEIIRMQNLLSDL
jgi:uncharacterized protein (DUF305 family)